MAAATWWVQPISDSDLVLAYFSACHLFTWVLWFFRTSAKQHGTGWLLVGKTGKCQEICQLMGKSRGLNQKSAGICQGKDLVRKFFFVCRFRFWAALMFNSIVVAWYFALCIFVPLHCDIVLLYTVIVHGTRKSGVVGQKVGGGAVPGSSRWLQISNRQYIGAQKVQFYPRFPPNMGDFQPQIL